MAGPSERASGSAFATQAGGLRQPVFAGRFYPADAVACRREVQSYLGDGFPKEPAGTPWIGGIVPHAGWICSAALAGATIAQLAAAGSSVEVVVIFAAIHTPLPPPRGAALDRDGRWAFPGGGVEVADAVRHRLLDQPGDLFAVDERFHVHEHAVEVELPLVERAFAGAMVLPVEVPVNERAVEIGAATAEAIASAKLRAVYLASSDLTHYGPAYRFMPAGIGPVGLAWAKENDRRLLDLVSGLAAEQVVPHVRAHHNACGAGAIAAMLAACKRAGATQSRLLRHASSFETLATVAPQPPVDAVGYAAVVVG